MSPPTSDCSSTRLRRCRRRGRLPSVVAGVRARRQLAWSRARRGVGRRRRRRAVPDRVDHQDVDRGAGAAAARRGAAVARRPGGPVPARDRVGAATIADLLAHTGGLHGEPDGPWWERSTGVDFADLAAANDGSGAGAGARRVLPLPQPRLRAARRGRRPGCAARPGGTSSTSGC